MSNLKEKINDKKSKKKSAKRRTIVVLFSIVFIIIAYIMYRGNYLEYLEIGKLYWGDEGFKLDFFIK